MLNMRHSNLRKWILFVSQYKLIKIGTGRRLKNTQYQKMTENILFRVRNANLFTYQIVQHICSKI